MNHRCTSLAAMVLAALVMTACAGKSPANPSPSSPIVPAAEGTGPYSASVIEGTGPESALEKVHPPAVAMAGPTFATTNESESVSGRAASSKQCQQVLRDGSFPGDVTVETIKISPAGAIEPDESACTGATCSGYTFVDDLGTCGIGVRWHPESGVSYGTATLTLSGQCFNRQAPYCGYLSAMPGPSGQKVWFNVTVDLIAGR